MSDGFFTNHQGRASGAKILLIAACVFPCGYLMRDLLSGISIGQEHVALMGFIMFVGLINRLSARGHIKLSVGRDGISMEADKGAQSSQ